VHARLRQTAIVEFVGELEVVVGDGRQSPRMLMPATWLYCAA
jgi:hypothetical protein